MRVYKGFNKKIQAKHGKGTFQYEKGKTYKEEKSKTRSLDSMRRSTSGCLQWYPTMERTNSFCAKLAGV